MPTRVSIFALLVAVSIAQAEPQSPATGIEFYETRIRPALSESCYPCHGPKLQQSNLRVDSRAALLRGGNRGPALVVGAPEQSRLIAAVRYGNPDLQMPPQGKLDDTRIADLAEWIRMGAPAPEESPAPPVRPSSTYDFEDRRRHWAYQPVRDVAPPPVTDATWGRTPIDRFVLARLEAAGLRPAPPADRAAWLRRATFDLIGLPPSPAEVEAFLADNSAGAYEGVVDRLLASPHYGERWARHWLDLVRFAETLGHEFDFEIQNAWRYRDYVIRAFNSDVPYDRFVLEHLAGDLVPDPRRHPTAGFNESILGTGFFWLGEGKHSPVDVRQEQADRMDNQIDVLGKAFFAQTLACARCHDHKFDAVATKDYYALAGYLKSSRYQQAFLDAPERIAAPAARLREIRRGLEPWVIQSLRSTAAQLGRRLVAAGDERWQRALAQSGLEAPEHLLHVWAVLSRSTAEPFAARAASLRRNFEAQADAARQSLSRTTLFEDFDTPGYTRWNQSGDAFAAGPSRPLDVVVRPAPSPAPLSLVRGGVAHSGLDSRRLEGALRSETFTIDRKYVHLRAAGCGGQVHLVIDGFTLIRNPIYGGLSLQLDSDLFGWRTIDVSMWQGHRAYFEIADSTTPMPAHAAPAGEKACVASPNSYVAVDEIRFSDEQSPPAAGPHPLNLVVLADPLPDSPGALAERYAGLLRGDLDALVAGKPGRGAVLDLALWLSESGLIERNDVEAEPQLAEFRRIEASLPEPQRAPAMADGTGEDECIFQRGNYRTPGERAERRPPPALVRSAPAATPRGSGRLELARSLVGPQNPLLARVLVNRIWQHHFGAGLVRTPDDFGRMGERPTHPDLLDWLAAEFVRQRWSIKAMHRLMLLSSAYRMSGRDDPKARETDPENRLLSRIPLQRLEAETIRDAILAVSGRLDPKMYGPGVPPHLTPFMEGRGRPARSGPLDGDGRRSIYLSVRRNFLNPMFLAFDYPVPFTTIGRRTISNVPAQALALLNGPFVVAEALRWAERALAPSGRSASERIGKLFLAAYARAPRAGEIEAALAFLDAQSARLGGAAPDVRAWADLCHALINAKEFIFVP